MILAWPLCVIFLMLDADAARLVLDVHASAARTLRFAIVHMVACLLFAPAWAALLPAPYRQRVSEAMVFAFAVALALPVLGMAGLLLCLAPALLLPNPVGRAMVWKHPRPLSLPHNPADAGESARPSWAAGLAGSLHSADPKRRAGAVISTLSLDDRLAEIGRAHV